MATTWTITRSAAHAKGMKPQSWTIEELHEFLPADGSMTTIYTSYGHTRRDGQECFGRTHVRAAQGRVECLTQHVEDKGAWRVIAGYPLGAGRVVRILTR